MPFCPECGLRIEGQKFCPNCGTKQVPIILPPVSVPLSAEQLMPSEESLGKRGGEATGADISTPAMEETRQTSTSVRRRVALPFRTDVIKRILSQTQDLTSEYAEDDIRTNSAYSVLCYCSPLVFVPLLNGKDSPFVKFHVGQGLNVFIGTVLTLLGRSMGLELVGMLNWPDGISGIISVIVSIPFIALLAGMASLSLLGISNAMHGKARMLPYIGKFDVLAQEYAKPE